MARNQCSPECVVIGIVIIIILGCIQYYYLFNPYLPGQIATKNLETTYEVKVQKNQNEIVFTPRQSQFDTGVILYSDSYVDPGAYSPIAMKLAEEGLLVVLTIARNNKSFFSSFGRSYKIPQFDKQDRFTRVRNWFIGGHGDAGSQVLYQAEHMISNDELGQRLTGVILMSGQPMTHTVKTGKKSSKTVVTQTTLKKNDLCSLYFSHNREGESVFDSRSVSKEYEKGAISQLPLKYRRIVQTQGNYYQFADYELNKSPNFRRITQHTIKFIRQCLDTSTWDKSYYNDNEDTEKSKSKKNKQDLQNKEYEQDQL